MLDRPANWLSGEIIDPAGFARECEILAALPAGWLRGYVREASTTADCNVIYHVGAGLAALAQSAPADLFYPFGQKVYLNLYVMLLGASGSRKTAAINKAERVLRGAGPVAGNIHKHPASVEQLIDMVVAQPHGILLHGEFGSFLSSAEHGYRTPMKARLTEIFDCTPQSRVKANGKNTDERVPKMSLVAGITPGYLERHTEEVDFTEGFIARFLLFEADRARYIELPPLDEDGERSLSERLQKYWESPRAEMSPPGVCLGLDERAKELRRDWRDTVIRQAEKDATIAGGARASMQRAEVAALKISTLIAWDSGEARASGGKPWYVREADLLPALRITEWHIESARRIAAGLASDKDMRDRRAVLRELGSTWRPVSRVMKRAKLLKRRFDDVMRTLIEEKTVDATVVEGEGTMVRLNERDESGRDAVAPATSMTQDIF